MAYLDCCGRCYGRSIVTDEVSQMGFTRGADFPVYRPRTFITSGYSGTLGAGFPTELGVRWPSSDAGGFDTGDGGFLFAVEELAKASSTTSGGDAGV